MLKVFVVCFSFLSLSLHFILFRMENWFDFESIIFISISLNMNVQLNFELCECTAQFLIFSLFLRIFLENPKDWSDHALWWPSKNTWLLRTRSTLDQCGVHADALLHFTPMHKVLRVQVSHISWNARCFFFQRFCLNLFGIIFVASRFAQSWLSRRLFSKHISSGGEFVQRPRHSTPGRIVILQTVGATAFKEKLFIVSKGKVSGQRIWIWARLHFTRARH